MVRYATWERVGRSRRRRPPVLRGARSVYHAAAAPASSPGTGAGTQGAGPAAATAATRERTDDHGVPDARAQRLRGVDAHARHDDLRQRERRGRVARAARPLHRGRGQPDRHGGRLQPRPVRGDHRPLAGAPAGRGARARSCSPPRAASRWATEERPRPLAPAPARGARRLAAPARRRPRRPLPGARLRSVHAAGRDAALPRRRRRAPGRSPTSGSPTTRAGRSRRSSTSPTSAGSRGR